MSTAIKTAALAAAGVATAWGAADAKADDTASASFSSTVELKHQQVLYTSNVSVIHSDNTSTLQQYATGASSINPSSALTTDNQFSLSLPQPNLSLSPGDSYGGHFHDMDVVGLTENNEIVIGSSAPFPPPFSTYFSGDYSSVVNALLADDLTTLASLTAFPSGGFNPVAPPVYPASWDGTSPLSVSFSLLKYDAPPQVVTDVTTISLPTDIGTGTLSLPEPTTAMLLGVPAAGLFIRRRRRRA